MITAQSGDADKPAIVLDSARRKRLIDELRVVAKLSDILEFCNFDEAATLKLFKPDGMVGLNGRTNSSQELEKMLDMMEETVIGIGRPGGGGGSQGESKT